MKFRQLTQSSYEKFSRLRQTLYKEDRGYGLLEVEYEGLIFALPLRSNLKHKHGMKTILKGGKWCGIDYSKALVSSSSDFKEEAFKVRDKSELCKLQKNKLKIEEDFGKYVMKYIETYQTNGDIVRKCGHTTLVHFHKELGL